jgi:hypothetical protein
MKPSYEFASHVVSVSRRVVQGTTSRRILDHAFRGVSRRSTQWIRKAGFTLSKLCAVSVRDLPIKNRNTGWPRPKNGRGSDNLANSGSLAQASHQDLRKKENEALSGLPWRLRRNLLSIRQLAWLAVLSSDGACSSRIRLPQRTHQALGRTWLLRDRRGQNRVPQAPLRSSGRSGVLSPRCR